MDQHHKSQHCHEQAEELQPEGVTPHGPSVPFPPMLHTAMASIHCKQEWHFVPAEHQRIHLTSTFPASAFAKTVLSPKMLQN